ncbi:hypothetical protein JCM11251_006331 [Rhodosporidiobolus azoricus]
MNILPAPPDYPSKLEVGDMNMEENAAPPFADDGWVGKLARLEEQMLLELEAFDRNHVALRYLRRRKELVRELRHLDSSAAKYLRLTETLRRVNERLADVFEAESIRRNPMLHRRDKDAPSRIQREFEHTLKEMDKLTSLITTLRLGHSLPIRTWPPPAPPERGVLNWVIKRISCPEKRRLLKRHEDEAEDLRLRGPQRGRVLA